MGSLLLLDRVTEGRAPTECRRPADLKVRPKLRNRWEAVAVHANKPKGSCDRDVLATALRPSRHTVVVVIFVMTAHGTSGPAGSAA
jgi:hypothetical protein